ncbi:cyclic-di-AMP phosphodiesterase PgpH-like [Ylistrum balloti]|uniref:cyclic-di-AMP phosphodiesterase PgpH-like n=1 Tax=Ylistrum balloti TaxID=509963 RepID=UPI0029059834|nr:cyclic-di-AMP phosphodiesterase PgpH-like [Ylistrum balloti]
MILIGVTWGLLLTSGQHFDPNEFTTGDIAPRTIRSTSQLIIENPEATEQARQAAIDTVLPIVDRLESLPETLQQRASKAFKLLQTQKPIDNELKQQLEKTIGSPIDKKTYQRLLNIQNDVPLQEAIQQGLILLGETRVATEPQKWEAAYPNGVLIRSSNSSEKEPLKLLPIEYKTVLSALQAAKRITEKIVTHTPNLSAKERLLLTNLLSLLIQPNLLPNPIETEKAQEAAKNSVKPVYFQLKPGEVIVRSGERITTVQAKQLVGLHHQKSHYQEHVASIAKILLLILAVFILIPYTSQPRWRNLGHPQDLIFLLVMTGIVLSIIQFGRNLTDPLLLTTTNLPREAILLVLPYATVGMIFRLFFRPKIAFRIAVLFAFALSLFIEPMILIFPYTLLGSLASIHVLRHSKQRSQFYRSGFIAGLVQSAIWLLYSLIESSIPLPEIMRALTLAFLGGIIASILTATLMPLCEWIGRYVSEVRLLELAQDDQPLLKWLHLNAPGTFNHSISVARLAESAAEQIGADELLTRVGAYYHDIGKGYWPSYFVENQRTQNPHDKLKPQLSSRVIIAHVTQGVELARKNNLPSVITDFILEHHGTSRVEYFYNQAKEQHSEKEDITDDTTYRYPGPKPNSKETALVMLADVVESATRTLDNPTPDRISAFVSRLIEKIYADNQLDQAPLTLKDLSIAKKAFTDVLTGMYHHRIDYPLGLKPGDKRAEETVA